jgi:hypothetical protein
VDGSLQGEADGPLDLRVLPSYNSSAKKMHMRESYERKATMKTQQQEIGLRFASSKTCHHCGWVKEDLTLAHREWMCQQCGTLNERDLNAAQNIKDGVIRLMTEVPGVASSAPKFACGVGSSGSLATVSETSCGEAGSEISSDVA